MAPLQLLSSPSQTSAEGCWFWLQRSAPFEQTMVPFAHTPGLPVAQLPPQPGTPEQEPLWQVSPTVHALLSLHAVPLAFDGFEQAPVDGLQLPALWH